MISAVRLLQLRGRLKGTMSIRQEYLGGGIYATVSDAHTFGTDAIALAYFAAPKRNTTACDLGSGCGIIPLLFCRDGLCSAVTAVEIQPDACRQIENAVTVNHLQAKIRVVQEDLRRIDAQTLPLYSFDLCTMNPPYQADDTGLQNSLDCARIARHEVLCSIADVAVAADKLLRFGGRLCLCHRPERLTDVLCAMREHGIEPKRMQFLSHRIGKTPRLVLVEGKKGGAVGLRVLPTLYLRQQDGAYTCEALRMYGLYQNERTTP